MNPPTDNTVAARRIFMLLFAVVLAACLYIVIHAVVVTQTNGLLRSTSSSDQAVLSVSQPGRQATIIGTGKAAVYLKPGDYQIYASYGGNHAAAVVHIYKKQTTVSNLKLKGSVIPSAGDINFKYIDSLIDSGLTSSQITVLKQAFLQFKPSAQQVTVDTASIQPAPHNPNVDTSFTINFKVSVDSITYNAAANYSDLENVRLYLYNPQTNGLVFDSYATAENSKE